MGSDAKILLDCIENIYNKRIESGQNKESACAFWDIDVKIGEIADWSADRFRSAKKDLANNEMIKYYANNFQFVA